MHVCNRTAATESKMSDLCRADKTRSPWWVAVSIAPVVILAGCSGGITRVEMDSSTQTVCDSSNSSVCGVLSGQTVNFKVWGQGKCDSVGLKFGDGSTAFSGSFDFGGAGGQLVPWLVSHKYDPKVWPGPKTIHAYSVSNCVGEAKLPLNVLRGSSTNAHTEFQLAFGQPGTKACSDVPGTLPLRKNTTVRIMANPNPNVKINFGCLFGGCIHDADGEKNSVAPASFAFPGFAKYSLIMQVGTQIVQGGTSMSFTTNQSGLLQVCVNDEPSALADNTGAWGLGISVDESQAP